MIASRFLIILLLIISSPAFAAPWEKLAPGISYKRWPGPLPGETDYPKNTLLPPVHIFRIQQNRYNIRPIIAESGQKKSIRVLAESVGADLRGRLPSPRDVRPLIAINANFFDPSGKPLGLVIQNKKIISPFKNISWWGVLAFKRDRILILPSKNYRNDPSIQQAFQSGPRLVAGGKPVKLKEEVSPKSAVGITRKGEFLIVATQRFASIQKLARWMALSSRRGGLDCVEALNLDGGSSTQLYAHVDSFSLYLPSFVGIPVGLGVFPK